MKEQLESERQIAEAKKLIKYGLEGAAAALLIYGATIYIMLQRLG